MMKKMIAIILALLLTSAGYVFADDDYSSDIFEYSEDGTILKYYGEEYVFIPSYIGETTLYKIGDNAFMDLGIEDVYIDEGITEIGKSAFSGCNMKSITLPSTLEKIGDNAFAYCDFLESVFCFADENLEFEENSFEGTGHIEFYIYCKNDTPKMSDLIKSAKGDSKYTVEIIHENLKESTGETDIFGANMVYCPDCGYKGSAYIDEIYEPFNDVDINDWYYKYVVFAYGMGIVNGKSETVFDPDGSMTCGEAVKIAAEINASQTTGIEFIRYGENWYDVYVDYCYETGIIEDYITFNWDEPITRGEMAYLFSRCDAYQYYLNDVPITDIPDVYDTTPYAYEILDLYNKGVAVGDENFYFNPDSDVKRCEAAAFISRIIGYEMRIELPKG